MRVDFTDIFGKVKGLFSRSGKSHVATMGAMSQKEVASKLRRVLESFNCTVDADKEEDMVVYRFDYQNGHFIARINADASIGLIFPSIIEDKAEHLGAVRSLVNRVNLTENIAKAYYTFNENDNTVHIHVGAALNPDGLPEAAFSSQVSALLSLCFSMRDLMAHLHTGIDDASRDFDDESYMMRRERRLLTELEMTHSTSDSESSYIAASERLTLEDVVARVFGREISITGARVVTDTVTELSTLNEICYLDLLSTVIDYGDDIIRPGHKPQVKFARQNATVIADYRMPGDNPDATRRQIVLNLHAEGHDGRLFYVRISGVANAPDGDNTLTGGHTSPAQTTCSLLVAYDFLPEEERRSEVRFLIDDANDKIAAGNADELTPEQRMLCASILPVVDYDLYRGRQAFLDGRYYQALVYLEKSFDYLNSRYHDLDEDARETFFNVCYYIGFCYCEMRRYREAYYFLDIVYPLNRANYTSEYVNCLVNARDFRSIMALDSITKSLESDKDAASDPEKVSFMDFIKRRRAYVLIDTGQYLSAESLLKEMLDQPANQDFAIGELAYLQHLRETNPEAFTDPDLPF